MRKLYMMCGIPASGKSTYIQSKLNDKTMWVSRDLVRFSILKEGEDYFAHEKEVYDIYCKLVNSYLEAGYDVYADATHLTKQSRKKFLKKVHGYFELNAIAFDTNLELAIERNEKRDNKTRVPLDKLMQMYSIYTFPTKSEGFDNIEIIEAKA